MDIADLQAQLRKLPAEQQDQLAAFLSALRLQRDGLVEEMQAMLDDKSPENWVSWEDAKRDLGIVE